MANHNTLTSPLLAPRYIRDLHSPTLPDLFADLTSGAADEAEAILQFYGNTVSPNQSLQLTTILGRMALLSSGHPANAGRYVFGMGCGRGKTTSIRTFITETYRLNIVDCPIIVAASKVSQLVELKRDLISDGVPEGDIGLYHSYRHDPVVAERVRRGEIPRPDNFADEPSSIRHPANFRVVLLTHSRVKSGKGELGEVPDKLGDIQVDLLGPPSISQAMYYRLNAQLNEAPILMKRNLLVWDEGLISSKARTVDLAQIRYELDLMETAYRHDERWHPTTLTAMSNAVTWVRACVAVLETELRSQKNHNSPRPIELPQLDKGTHKPILKLFNGEWRDAYTRMVVSTSFNACSDLLRMSTYRLRLILTNGTNALLRFDVELPTICDRIVVLDGSFPIRTLERIDPDMKDGFKADGDRSSNFEDYSQVVLHRATMGAGRGSLSDKLQSGELASLIATHLKKLNDESCLIFTYKDRSKKEKFVSVLREQLERDHNIDLRATIETTQGPKLKYPILTWGNETATNSYSYCDNVLLAGVYHLPEREVAALVVSQQRDLLKSVKQSEIQAAIDGEVFTAAHQAVMRVVRTWDGDRAKAKNLWVMYPNSKIESALRVVMPGLSIKEWVVGPQKDKGDMALYELLAVEVMEYLYGLPDEVTKVSARKVMDQFGGYTKWVKKDALEMVRSDVLGWETQGRSFVRRHSVTGRNVFEEASHLAT
jgi:hypothetical protein